MRRVKRHMPGALAVALFVLALSAPSGGRAEAEEGAAPIAGPAAAPDFLIRECVHADSIHLADYLDGPVLLMFYDGGLVTNIHALRYAREWDRRYRGDGLSIIAVHAPLFEPSKVLTNAIEVVGASGAAFPVGFDMERRVYDLYGVSSLPAFVLIRPGGAIAARISGEKAYADVERAIQDELRRLRPGTVLPLIAKPFRPWDDPGADLLKPTPLTRLGYASGNIANADSGLYDEFGEYGDPGDRMRGAVFLDGNWKVGAYSVSYSDSLGRGGSRMRIIYSGKAVWILPAFESGRIPRVYVKQDRSYLPADAWGKDIEGDQAGRPYIRTAYSIPCQIVDNPAFGTHQLEIIPAEGDVSFYYLFFEAAARK